MARKACRVSPSFESKLVILPWEDSFAVDRSPAHSRLCQQLRKRLLCGKLSHHHPQPQAATRKSRLKNSFYRTTFTFKVQFSLYSSSGKVSTVIVYLSWQQIEILVTVTNSMLRMADIEI